MRKALVFDMDGTIVDFYGVPTWLEDLQAKSTRPYEVAQPLYDMDKLIELLYKAKQAGYMVAITTWLAKEADREYKRAIAEAKIAWLERFGFPYDEIHCVQYGTTKANCTRGKADVQILFDDNADVRKGWNLGPAVDANMDIMVVLEALVSGLA